MDTRRQSGLWARNHETGFYEQRAAAAAATAGPYEYYQPPSTRPRGTDRSSAGGGGGGAVHSEARKVKDLAAGVAGQLHEKHGRGVAGGTTSEDLRRTQHASAVRRPAPPSATLPDESDAAPANVRSAPWSPAPPEPEREPAPEPERDPELVSPGTQAKPRQVSDASERMRRGSVPDRSPLQKLEREFASKEEKRARMEQAEHLARQKSRGARDAERTLPPVDTRAAAAAAASSQRARRSERERAAGDGPRRPNEGEKLRRRPEEERPRQAPTATVTAKDRFKQASKALRDSTSASRDTYAASSPRDNTPPRQESARALDPPLDEPRPAHTSKASAAEGRRREPVSTGNDGTPATGGGEVDAGRAAGSSKRRRRVRDVGLVGAATAAAGAGLTAQEAAAERGKAAHEKRKSLQLQQQQQQRQQDSPITPVGPSAYDGGLARSESKGGQQRSLGPNDWPGPGASSARGPQDPQIQDPHGRHVSTSGGRNGGIATRDFQDLNQPADARMVGPPTTGAQGAPGLAGFGAETSPAQTQQQEKRHRLGGLFHRRGNDRGLYQPAARPLDEWRDAGVARLTADDLEILDRPPEVVPGTGAPRAVDDDKGTPWWEKREPRSSSSARPAPPPVQAVPPDGPYEEEAKSFYPALFLKCGPLLRYTGLRREGAPSGRGREIWRGSIMIVTDDRQSDYSAAPTLRIFAQPMDLHTPPPPHVLEAGPQLPPEAEDPVAGQVKLSRSGRPLYVRPVHDIEGGIDLSREENPQGLYSASRTPVLGPQTTAGTDGRQSTHITFQDKSRIKAASGEQRGRTAEVQGVRLHAERGCVFWRFNMEIELAATQKRIAYRINHGPAIGFWVPGRGETMNIMFHSCNGFSLSVNSDEFSGPDPLWRDVLNKHQSRPFHVMIGGGDQIYNDAVMRAAPLFREWLGTKNPEHKHRADFTPDMHEELEAFYLDRYAMWFSQGLFGMANSQIPMINIWDDHDIIDGFGSYPDHFMRSRVFMGLGAVAFKYYMLFQHQSVVAETDKNEPSWVLGPGPGPYIGEQSRSVFMTLGHKVGFLGLDCRTERRRDEILSQETYDVVFDRLRYELGVESGDGSTPAAPSGIKHLIVLLGVPIAYPRLNFLENILTSKVMDPIKAIGRMGILGGFVNKFDGGVEILDDLDDHWTAKHHKAERNWLIQELQELAAETSVRITILGGDVHLAAMGQFYTPKKFDVAKDKDHRYMPNVISSAIVNTPPPGGMADLLNRRNKVHHLDEETNEDMIPMFDQDVDGRKRNNTHLLPRRNFCTIREFMPGSTPPASPQPEPGLQTPTSGVANGDAFARGRESVQRDRRYPPGSMGRTMSLTRGPANLVRRLSGSGRSKNPPVALTSEHGRSHSLRATSQPPAAGLQRSYSLGGPHPESDSYFPQGAGERPIYGFYRRPTSLSVKEARKAADKGGPDETTDGHEPGAIDLEGGLDISLNVEIDQHDPAGYTIPYRLLVPALWYDGEGDVNTMKFKGRRVSLMDRIRGRVGRRSRGYEDYSDDDQDGQGYSRSPTPSPPPNARAQPLQPPQQLQHVQPLPPQQLQQQKQQQGGAYNAPLVPPYEAQRGQGVSGDSGGRRSISEPYPRTGYNDAYSRGYNLSSPPIGSASAAVKNNTPPQQRSSSYRRPGGPVHKPQPANEPWRHDEEYQYSEGSLTPSEEYNDRSYDGAGGGNYGTANPNGAGARRPSMQQPQSRRLSKAERFFGIGDEGGPWEGEGGRRPSLQADDVYAGVGGEGKKKPAWKIWK